MKYIVGNWKSNKTISEAKTWIGEVNKSNLVSSDKLEVVLCPSLIHLTLFEEKAPELALGAQTLSPFPDGTYTGAVSARMLSGLVKYVILGHSERRGYFKVTNDVVAKQVRQALDNAIIPIVSVDDDLWRSQLAMFGSGELEKMMVMYEPPEAISKPIGPIGEGESASPERVLGAIKKIKNEFEVKAFFYGGSVKSNNITEYLGEELISGVIPGSASLNPDEWDKMIEVTKLMLG